MPASFLSTILLIAVPVVVLMTIWVAVTLGRVLFPLRPQRRRRAVPKRSPTRTERMGTARSRDIVEDLHKQSVHLEEEPQLVEGARQEFEPLFGDLWLRRN